MTVQHMLLLLAVSMPAYARTVEVRAGGTYGNLESAASVVQPGDTIVFRRGEYPGNQYVDRLQGRADAWVTIMAAIGEQVTIVGGSNGWQLTDPAYLRIQGFSIEGQTGNGWNFDDGGSYDTPAHHVVIQSCEWKGIDATGNNDLLKLSGVDSFEVRNCFFHDGAAGGSMVDMVGCHDGSFVDNDFARGGSNSVQAKGGTRGIRIERNRFVDGGQRSINVGGSTGLSFFRPQGVSYESADIRVYSNVFVGSTAPIAFVGTVRAEVVNNTFWMPDKWAFRILQENRDSAFVRCGDNIVRNNIIVVGNVAANPTINIGPDTRPESFTFGNNLWFNVDNASWSGPNIPTQETQGIVGRDPLLQAPPDSVRPRNGSPVIGAGYAVIEPTHDYLGQRFASPRSIGAAEWDGFPSSITHGPRPPARQRRDLR